MSPNAQFAQQPQRVYATKTELYLKVKKPLLERQRRARVNQCLDALKTLVAEFQGDDAIMRMDKAEMLESTIAFMRRLSRGGRVVPPALAPLAPMDSFRNGYMNAVNEVSRVMAATPGMSVDLGKIVMTHLGSGFNRLLQQQTTTDTATTTTTPPSVAPAATTTMSATADKHLKLSRPSSPASSGYHSDSECESPLNSPSPAALAEAQHAAWRPWL